jgi:D-xylose 1-dehydrogenase
VIMRADRPNGAYAVYPSLAGKVVLVTGGATGIGASLVRHFAANGASVGFLDVQEAAALELASEIAGAGHPEPIFELCDLRDIPSVHRSIERFRAALGPASVLVNNAANDQRQRFEEVSVEEFDETVAVNLRHVYFATQAVVPQMRELGGGSIVNLSSIAWMGGGPDLTAYAAAKAGIVGITNLLARALGPDGIRVNAIAPGAVLTERQHRLWFRDDARVAEVVGRQCIRERLLEPDIARMALFLAADDSRMVTKQCIIVDAGLR